MESILHNLISSIRHHCNQLLIWFAFSYALDKKIETHNISSIIEFGYKMYDNFCSIQYLYPICKFWNKGNKILSRNVWVCLVYNVKLWYCLINLLLASRKPKKDSCKLIQKIKTYNKYHDHIFAQSTNVNSIGMCKIQFFGVAYMYATCISFLYKSILSLCKKGRKL